jgi:hypothetical protein
MVSILPRHERDMDILSMYIESISGLVLFKYLKKETALDVLGKRLGVNHFLETTNQK